jgi:hypothetical protein
MESAGVDVQEVKVDSSGGSISESPAPAPAPDTAEVPDIKVEIPRDSIRIHPDLLLQGVEYVKQVILPLVVGDSKDFTTFPYVEVATELMVWVEKTQKTLHGFDKRRVVLRIMETLLEKQEEILGGAFAGHEAEVSTIIHNVIPIAMDFIVNATKGKLELNHLKQASKVCIPILTRFWCKKT